MVLINEVENKGIDVRSKMEGYNRLWQSFYDPVSQNVGEQDSLTQPLADMEPEVICGYQTLRLHHSHSSVS